MLLWWGVWLLVCLGFVVWGGWCWWVGVRVAGGQVCVALISERDTRTRLSDLSGEGQPDRGLAPYTPLPRSSGRFVGSWVRGPRRIPAGANTPPNQMMRPNSPREALRFGRFRVWHGSQYHALDPKGRASWRHGSPKESTVSPADCL